MHLLLVIVGEGLFCNIKARPLHLKEVLAVGEGKSSKVDVFMLAGLVADHFRQRDNLERHWFSKKACIWLEGGNQSQMMTL